MWHYQPGENWRPPPVFYPPGIILAVLIIILCCMFIYVTDAQPHDFYSSSCCGGKDCRPVPCDQLVEDNTGWLYLPTNNHFERSQVFPSQDRHCHVCISRTGDVGRSLCAYVQQGA